MKRGFIFSLDAAFALLILILVYFTASYYFFEAESLGWAREGLKAQAQDLLALLDYEGDLQTLNTAQIQSEINALMPPEAGMRVRIRTFTFSTGFNVDQDIYLGNPLPTDDRDISHGRHLFLIFSPNNAVSRFGNAEFWVWYE